MITGFLEQVRRGGRRRDVEGAAGLGKARLLARLAQPPGPRSGPGSAPRSGHSVELAVLMEALFGGAESL